MDWEGKVSLIQAAETAKIERFIFFSIMNAEKYPSVPLMEIKHCTELFLANSELNYTILRPCGFFQGLIGQYAIPILERQSVWVTGEASPLAYMDTQDVARFALQALVRPETARQTFNLAGLRAWGPYEVIRLCERLSGQEAKVSRLPLGLLRSTQRLTRFFEWGWNIADRLAFAEVIATGEPLDAPMEQVYPAFDLDPASMISLEVYLQEYFSRILKKLKELDYPINKRQSRKRSPFKSS